MDKLAPGRFLVASRDLGDPNFAQAVVLLVQYGDEHGAMGLIVNRRTDVPLSRVLNDLKEAKSRTDPIYIGGPVELNSVMALLQAPPTKLEGAKRVFGDVYMMSSKELLQKTLASPVMDADAFHAFLGYAGWEPGQLEHEVELGRLAHHAGRCGRSVSLRSRLGLAAADSPDRDPDRKSSRDGCSGPHADYLYAAIPVTRSPITSVWICSVPS